MSEQVTITLSAAQAARLRANSRFFVNVDRDDTMDWLDYTAAKVLDALPRPIERGDVVRIPFAPTDTFEVRCVEDDEAWVLDVKSGGRLTVKLDCIERVQP